MERFHRSQILLEAEQRRRIEEVAQQWGRSISNVTRQIVNLGLEKLKEQDEFVKREVALQRATALRNSMPLLDVNVADDLQKIREERLEQIAPNK
ncbi:MAG: hypothetical protein M1371_09085 [Actinobacteria bacterium]|nr:hypothetical protein [Actinomycetota bacterium]